jgi:hypothetical protein
MPRSGGVGALDYEARGSHADDQTVTATIERGGSFSTTSSVAAAPLARNSGSEPFNGMI